MKAIIIAIVIISLAASSCSQECNTAEFAAFKEKYSKIYASEVEEQERCVIFTENFNKITAHNENSGETYNLGVNAFADLTVAEFAAKASPFPDSPVSRKKRSGSTPLVVPANWQPGSLDLRTSAIPIKNMGSCGAPNVFAAISLLEYRRWKNTGIYRDFSEEQGVDCARPNGCNGGWPHEVFNYQLANGANFESVYPYVGVAGTCNSRPIPPNTNGLVNTSIPQWHTIPNNERLMAYVINQKGWITAGLNADLLQFYTSGVITGFCPSYPNHMVTLVGYGFDQVTQKKFWIARNVWGSSWGENGYFRIERDVNKCGIADPYEFYRLHLA